MRNKKPFHFTRNRYCVIKFLTSIGGKVKFLFSKLKGKKGDSFSVLLKLIYMERDKTVVINNDNFCFSVSSACHKSL